MECSRTLKLPNAMKENSKSHIDIRRMVDCMHDNEVREQSGSVGVELVSEGPLTKVEKPRVGSRVSTSRTKLTNGARAVSSLPTCRSSETNRRHKHQHGRPGCLQRRLQSQSLPFNQIRARCWTRRIIRSAPDFAISRRGSSLKKIDIFSLSN